MLRSASINPLRHQKQFISIRAMSHPHESSLPQPLPHDAAHFPRHPAPPHLLRGPQGEHPQAPPLHAEPFGRLAIQSPLKGCELKNTWEVISTENTPANATSRRTSFCSTYNSVEEVPTTLSSGEVDDPRMGRLASPPLEQKREASVNPAGVHHSQRENSTSKHRETCCETLTHAKIEQGPEKFTEKTARQRKNSS